MEVSTLAASILDGRRIDQDEALFLFREAELSTLAYLADEIRRRKHPEGVVTYIIDRNLNPTNVCVTDCGFCAFYAKPKDLEKSYVLEREEIYKRVQETVDVGGVQVLMQSGHHPQLGVEWFEELMRDLKERWPALHLHAMAPSEIEHLGRVSKVSTREVLKRLMEAGMDSMPGGGAEVLVDRVHKAVFREKQSPDGWIDTARKVQKAGFKMNATMLYGHIERVEERVTHLMRLRELQDECGNFMAYIPLAFWPYHTDLANFGHETTGHLDQRSIAVGRLMLDNFPHVKAYWIMLTRESAQTALSFGANDIDGTVTEEKITHDAGTTEPEVLTVDQIGHLIREAGYEPVQRTTVYEEVVAS